MKINKIMYLMIPLLTLIACGNKASKLVKKYELYTGRSQEEAVLKSYETYDYFSNGLLKERKQYTRINNVDVLVEKDLFTEHTKEKAEVNTEMYMGESISYKLHAIEQYNDHNDVISSFQEEWRGEGEFQTTEDSRYTYTYNKAGKILNKIQENKLSSTKLKEEYQYDDLNRCISVIHSTQSSDETDFVFSSKIEYSYWKKTSQEEKITSYFYNRTRGVWNNQIEKLNIFNEKDVPIKYISTNLQTNRVESFIFYRYENDYKKRVYERYDQLNKDASTYYKNDEGFDEYAKAYTGVEDPIYSQSISYVNDGSGTYDARYTYKNLYDNDGNLIEHSMLEESYEIDEWVSSNYDLEKYTY